MATHESLVCHASFHPNYYNFVTVVQVFYIIKEVKKMVQAQEEKKMSNKYFTGLVSVLNYPLFCLLFS